MGFRDLMPRRAAPSFTKELVDAGVITIDAATTLADPVPPKVKPNLQSVPSYLTSQATGNRLPRPDLQLASTDLARLTRSATTTQQMSALAHSTPDMSASMFAYARLGIPKDFKVVAYNMDGTFNPDATTLAQQLAVRFDLFSDYGLGFLGKSSLRSVSEQLTKDMWLNGAMASELVLGKDRLPLRIQPVYSPDINFIPRTDGSLFPQQTRAGKFIDLDIPTFFFTELDRELNNPYPAAPMQSAIKPTYFAEEFQADLQRVVKRAVHPRLDLSMNEEKFMDSIPEKIKAAGLDEIMKFRLAVLTEFKNSVGDLNPDDALVHFDNITADYLNNGNASLSDEWGVLNEFQQARTATGTKTLPSILGHSVGSSNIASTETLQFMKNVEGAVTYKLNEHYSKIFTLAVRLFGQDCYVCFEYAAIDLRPQAELASHRQTEQSRLVQLLSLGFISDQEFAIEMTGNLPPDGFVPLSGTRFADLAGQVQDGSAGGAAPSNDGSTVNQKLNSPGPTGGKGSNSVPGKKN